MLSLLIQGPNKRQPKYKNAFCFSKVLKYQDVVAAVDATGQDTN